MYAIVFINDNACFSVCLFLFCVVCYFFLRPGITLLVDWA